MEQIIDALGRALRSLLHPKMLVLTLWPMLLSLLFWGALAWWFWDAWQAQMQLFSAELGIEEHLMQWGFVWLAHWLVIALLISVLLPAVYVTALIFTAIFAMPVMVKFVAGRDYPALEKKQGGSFSVGVWNALAASLVYVLLWGLTLPLWLMPFGALVMPTLLAAWLNRRLFTYDALAEHASHAEYVALRTQAGGRLFLMGALLGFVHLIPILNFFTPVYIGLAYTHFCLAQLQTARAQA